MAVGNRDPRDVSTILRVLFFIDFLNFEQLRTVTIFNFSILP